MVLVSGIKVHKITTALAEQFLPRPGCIVCEALICSLTTNVRITTGN